MSHGGSNGSTFRQMCYTEFNPTQGTGIVIMTNAIGGYPLYREVIALATPTNSLAEYVKNPDER